jgi:hypothetical protein
MAALLMACIAPDATMAATCTSPGQFQPALSIPTGDNPHSIAIGDFNSDGHQDLAVANSSMVQTGGSAGSISILFGVGNGTFQAPVNLASPGAPFGIVAADFNHDGILDLATADLTTNTVTIRLGNGSGGMGDGTFGAPQAFPAGSGPWNLVAVDLDGDGNLDLAVSNNTGTAAVSWLQGLGNGAFGAPQSALLSNLPNGLLATDLDGDGRPDLVVSVPSSHAIAILHNNGGLSFAGPVYVPAGSTPVSVSTADWDQDGIPDLVVTNGNSGNVQFLHGLGNATFSPPVSLGGGNVGWSAPLDANGDGLPDIVFGQTSDLVPTSVGLLLGDGHGGFSGPTWFPVGTNPLMIAVGDFDGNGKPDLAVANYRNNYISILDGACLADPNAPVLTSVRDVPNDQGGKVFLTWTKSALDVTGGTVVNYRVWRLIPPAQAAARLRRDPAAMASMRVIRRTAGPDRTEIDYWEALATLPAQRLPGYGYTAATTQDSLPSGNPLTTFMISALTNNIDVFYDSQPDSGYSVDNLSPLPPHAFVAMPFPGGVLLHWNPNTETDLAGYQLYRGVTAGFVPSPANLVASLTDTTYTDVNADPGAWYKLVALDIHSNQSPASTAVITGPTAATATALAPQVSADQIDLTWSVSIRGVSIAIERAPDGAAWQQVGVAPPDGGGFVHWTDHDVKAGAVYHYRLSIPDPAGALLAGEVVVRVPAAELALAGLTPNPLTSGAFAVRFSLPDSRPARIDVLDIGGRRVASMDVSSLGAGAHVVTLDRGQPIPAGVYMIHLTAGDRALIAKAVVMR